MSMCFCSTGCGCSGYAEGPFHQRRSCTCRCHDATCNCNVHRDRRQAAQAAARQAETDVLELGQRVATALANQTTPHLNREARR